MNLVILTGRPTKNPEFRRTKNGTSSVSFSLAVDRRAKEKKTDFPVCVAMGKLADVIAEYVVKGKLIGVTGEIRTRSYESKGEKRYVTEIMLSGCEFLEKKNQSVFEETKPAQPDYAILDEEDADAPF